MAVAWLVLAWLVGRRAPTPAARAIAAGLGVAAGLLLPDIDQWLPLHHRSAATHSVLMLFVLARAPAGVLAGTALGLGFHLAADCFPRAMVGYATVKWPLAGSIGAAASYGWLAAQSLAASAWGGWRLARDEPPGWALTVLAAAALMGVVYLWRDPGGWPALILYALAGWWAWRRA